MQFESVCIIIRMFDKKKKGREKMIFGSILEAVGKTPLIRLQRMVPAGGAEILVKYEGLNVGGSVKTRTALNMILEAEKAGGIRPPETRESAWRWWALSEAIKR